MSYMQALGLIISILAVAGGIVWLGNKGYFNKAKASYKGTEVKFDEGNWRKYAPWVAGIAVLIILAALISGCSSGDKAEPTAKFNCQGSYVGSYIHPEHDERVRLRNLSLTNRGIAITGDDAVDNAAAGGGAPDGGIWMGGSYSFDVDASCTVVRGSTMVFYAYPYDINGTIKPDGSFNLTWSGSGSAGRMDGKVESNNTITGTFHHPEPESYVYGVISGTFTPAVPSGVGAGDAGSVE